MTFSLTPPAHVSKGRAGLSAVVGQQVEQDGKVAGVQVLLGADAGHKYRLTSHADLHVSGYFRAQVSERTNVVAENAGITLGAAGAVVGGRANPILIEHGAVSLPVEGAPAVGAVQGALQRLTASQRSLLLALGKADRHGLRHTRPVARERQSGWLQSALALFRRGYLEKHREDGTHAIGDGAGHVWLTLTPEGEALRRRVAEEAA